MGDPEKHSPGADETGADETAFKAITPEEAAEMTEEESDTLSKLRDHVNAELKTRHQKGKTTTIKLTGFVKGTVAPVRITPRVIEELIATFSGDWNIDTTRDQREGTMLTFSSLEGGE